MDTKRIYSAEEIISIVKEKRVAIWGAGNIGKRLYSSLTETGLASNVECFVTTNGQADKVCNLSVIPYRQLMNDRKIFYLIAVHETILEEIENILRRNEEEKYLWVTPAILDITLGPPKEYSKEIDIKTIWAANKFNLNFAARYLAIEQYYGNREDGYDIYVKCMSTFSSNEVAKKRLASFISLLSSWDKYGYDRTKCSKVLENNICIDGAHRIVTAIYHLERSVSCDIYFTNKTLYEIHEEGVFLSPELAYKKGIDSIIVHKLEDMITYIDAKLGRG